ncbi:MAG: FtsQ-type POTRA domain-containing protein [Clostridia bacterium]|nr:FtsQ-type POTRA domain-containing protein [Clostridia bacterium]
MQDQGPQQSPEKRRAGNPGGASGADGRNLRDWQKNTWFGPAPLNSNPFEEPEDAPELRELRSSNVSNHTGSFWNDQEQTGYQFSAGQSKNPAAGSGTGIPKGKKRERLITLRSALVFVFLLVAALLVVYFGVFRIREIRVVGNSAISSRDVIRFSGIRIGDSILRLSEDETEKRLINNALSAAKEQDNYNYYCLQFRYLEKELPGTVTIAVREREACCYLTWLGIMYVMDKNGMVLYESEDTDMWRRVELVEVKGLDIRSGAQVGQTVVLSSATQEVAFKDLFLEMKILGCTSQILEADLSNPDSILLTTRDRFTVSMGNSESLHAKLRSMLLVRQKLAEMGKDSGTINVTNPEAPSYSPAAP